jgi:hypothetical protein
MGRGKGVWTPFGSEQGPMARCCENENEASISATSGNILDDMSKYQHIDFFHGISESVCYL